MESNYKLKNYHTHTYRCKHATGDVADYAAAAVSTGLSVLGITDHTPLPDNRWNAVRMDIRLLGEYIAAIDDAKSTFTDLVILKGMECEYSKEFHGFFKDELLGRLGFDYLIAGAHSFPLNGEWVASYGDITDKERLMAYAEYVVKTMESGLFTFIAHPDLFGNSYELWDENTIACSKYIFEAAQSLGVPLELNGYGLRKPKIDTKQGIRPMYPWSSFWELACDYKIKVIANSDAHRPEDVASNINELYEKADKLGLQVVDLAHLESIKW